ncbi:MAG: hypothetical protein LBP59_10990 [Planctomycetaceae bacterium]|jgi:hypothetical protein|nr:hypothetical protein [Planctomycetaceae bacterium]
MRFKSKSIEVKAVQFVVDSDDVAVGDSIMPSIHKLLDGTRVAATYGVVDNNTSYVNLTMLDGSIARIEFTDWIVVIETESSGVVTKWSNTIFHRIFELLKDSENEEQQNEQ